MRSFAKTFRAVLALCLVFSIVMSFVTVSADAVNLSQVSVASAPNEDGLYEVKYSVTGVSAGSASILVHDAANVASITNESIEYVGQKAPTSGAAEFTMLLEKGDYTVIGGGTGMTADTETLSLDAAPVFAVERFEDTLLDNDEAGVAHPVATDADGDDVTYRLEGAAAANFAISGANIVINAEGKLAVGKYEFTLVAASGDRTASIPVAITIESSDVKVERFDDVAPVTVAWGTAADAIKFPAVTYGEEEFAATWACDTYNANVAGNYTFTATVSSKDGYDISAAAAPTVVVTVEDKNVTVLDALEPVDVDWGTELEAVIAKLPVTVTSGADTFDVEAWACDNYVAETGSYTFTATLVAKPGYNVTAIATVVVNVGEKPDVVIEAFDAVENISVEWGTAVEAIKFAAVTAKGETFEATWVCDNYNAEVAGDYTFTADVKDKEGYDISGAAALTVVVTVEAKVVDKLDALEAVDVDWGTELEAVIAKLPVTVTSGADTFDVEAWACDNYEAVTGSYTFTATLVEKAGYNVTATATVVVNVGEEPDEVVAAFDPVAPFAVAWGTEVAAIDFPAVTYGGVEFEATWACADYNANKAGEYTFTATVADKDGYDISGAAELTVVVTVGQKVFAAENGEYTLNEDYYVEGTVNGDAVYVGGDAVVTITGGNYDGGYTPFGGAGNTAVFAYGNAVVNIKGGNFTIGGLARNEEGVLDVGQIDMIYAKENATINISGGTFEGADETVWLVNVKNDAYDAGTAKIVITGGTFINWDPTNGNGRGEKYIADGYYVKSAAVDGDIYYTVEKATVIEAFDAVEPITVAWGTAADAIEFPAVKAGDVEFEATWVCGNYNANVAGDYVFVAEVAEKAGYVIEAEELSVVVTVEAKVVDKLDALEAVDVDWGTELEAVIALLPAQVTSGADTFDVEAWACDNYEAVTGSYTFTATLVEKAGYNVTATATVVVNVGEEPDEVVAAFDAVAPIAVAWGTEVAAIDFPAVTYGGVEFEATWACADYNANKAGEYTFVAEVADKDGYDISGAAELTVVVTVGQKVFYAEEGEYTLDGDYYVEGTANGDAVTAAGNAVVTITGGNYNGGQTPVGGAGNTAVWAKDNAKVYITGGTFTIAGLPEGDAGQIDMIYARDNAEIYITGGTFKGADETVWLVNVKNDAYDAGTAKIVITGGTFINWDPTNGNGRGEKYIADGYTVKAATVGTETHYTVVEKTAVNTIDPITVFVMPGDLYEDVILTVPTEITSGDVVITNIEWPEVIGETWPPIGEAALNVEADYFEYNKDDVTLAEDAVPSINFVTIPDTFDLTVDGMARDYLISDMGKAVAVEVGYNGPEAAGVVEFFYSIVDHASGAEIVAKEALPNDGVIAYYETAEKGSSTDLIIYGTVGGKALISKTATILKANGLFDGVIYNNATESNPEYSALRVNKNREYTVSFNFVGRNGEYDFSAGKFVVEVVGTTLYGEVAGAVAANGSGSHTFGIDELAVIPDGAYTVRVTYCEGETAIFSKERNVNITNRGFWYTEFTVNNGTSLAVKNVGMDATIKLDSTNAEGNVYAGFKLLPYGAELPNDGTGTVLVNGNEYNEKINVSDKPVAAYSLYALANMTDNQNFYDFTFGKTVYVRNSFTNLSGIFVNGSATITPDIDGNNGNLTITPNWGGRKPAGDVEAYWTIKITHRYTDADVVLTEADVEGATIEEDGTLKIAVDPSNVDSGVTIKNAKAVLPAKVYYEVKAYVNGGLDKEVAKRTIYINVN